MSRKLTGAQRKRAFRLFDAADARVDPAVGKRLASLGELAGD